MNRHTIKIGMNGSMLDEKPTGVGIVSYNLINHLSHLYQNNNSMDVTVFTPASTLLNTGFGIVKLPGLLQSSRYGKLAAFFRFIWNTFYYPLVTRKFDLLFSPTSHGSFLVKNQIITIHDLLSLRYKNISVHQRFYFMYLLPKLVAKARNIITVSETSKKDIVHFFKYPESKIHVIHNGYDRNLYYGISENKFLIKKNYGINNYLLAVGPTYPHKNFETLINAYNESGKDVMDNYPLVIAGGKKKYLDHLKKYVKEIGLDNKVHFLGYVPIQLMPSLYREAYALVFPSLFEGFGLPLLEAMACGCPVIVSEASSMPEVCGEAVMYFDPTDKSSLILSLQKITSDKLLCDELKKKGFEQSKKFSWEQSAQKLKKIFDENLK